ncbi:uncharacterized protein TRAVEDRAFT_70248 [Trametes versicolor FP-101664 SS1]|uniref:uncharacterized protein n=1 Tax=Trametes versicolor (strain FP-101664) TaxID=717944 RepID=UPI0004622DCD|nr:uncharacterized protein TRAVEDRAFT_70248 [Trametes versicolor FP-101664 SS1]EIW62039.1 hypothetical protein TRAVEDRAFT_70248 [Trametes versicolor FP-101664 SS1]
MAALAAHLLVQARSRRMRPSPGILGSFLPSPVVPATAVRIAPTYDLYGTIEGELFSHMVVSPQKSMYSPSQHLYQHLTKLCTSPPCRSVAQKDTRSVQWRWAAATRDERAVLVSVAATVLVHATNPA